MTLDPGALGGSGWTFGLSPVVSAMLSGVVGACAAYMSSAVLLTPRCVSPSRSFFYMRQCFRAIRCFDWFICVSAGFEKKSYFTLRSGWAPDVWS